jgi:hypothetical protein
MTLEEVTKFVEVKESGKRSAPLLTYSPSVDAAKSTYRKHKKPLPDKAPDKGDPCIYCGEKGHGKSLPIRIRRKECPAYGHKCTLCNKDNHFENVCRSKDKPKADKPPTEKTDNEGAIFESLCTVSNVTSTPTKKMLELDHHLFDHLSNTWIKRNSKPQPFIKKYRSMCHQLTIQP